MIKEKLYFDDGFPLRLCVSHIDDYPIHYHEDMEIVFVLSGSLSIRNGFYSSTLSAGDFFIQNPKDVHVYEKTDEDNLTAIIQIDGDYFEEYYHDWDKGFFVTDIDSPASEEMEVLRNSLSRLIMEDISKDEGYKLRMVELAHGLVSALMDDFRFFSLEKGRFVNSRTLKKNRLVAGRMDRIQDYLYDNYMRKVTLQEISDREHLSIYYLSHIIKEATGLSYKEFLNYIRAEESEKLLLGTDMKISAISEAVGFSAVRYYVKYFTRWFNMDPKVYRENHSTETIGEELYPVMSPADNEDVRAAVQAVSNEIFRKYSAKARVGEMLTEVNALSDEALNLKLGDSELYAYLSSHLPEDSPAWRLFSLFKQAGGELLVATSEYLVSRMSAGKSAPVAVSVLMYDISEGPRGDDATVERTFRIIVPPGNYDVIRATYNITGYAPAAAPLRPGRQKSITELSSYPATSREVHAVGSSGLIFEMSLQPGGSELIFADEIKV